MKYKSSAGHEGIALVAPVSIPYQQQSDLPASYFIGSALRAMLKGASLDKAECDGLLVSSFSSAPDTAASYAEIFGVSLNWLEDVPYGGAAGVIGLRRAIRAVESGDADIIACIGGDTYSPEAFSNLLGRFTDFTRDAVTPYASGGANLPFAMLTRTYMNTYDAKREDFGRLCIMQRENAVRYRQAIFREPLSMDAYLNARVVAKPLRLFDCAMPCAGAEGFLVMTVERAKNLSLPYVIVRSSGERHNASKDKDMPLQFGWGEFCDSLYAAAGYGPEAIDIVQVYDDYPVMALLQLEELGFCEPGSAARHINADGFCPQGRPVQVNTSGGQLSAGQPGFGGGFIGLVESIRQLTDSALDNQFADVRTALASGFGMVNYDRGLCTAAAILESAKA